MPAETRPASVEDTLKLADDQIARTGQIISHLRDFLGQGDPDKSIQNLHGLIEEACAAALEGRRVSIALTLDLRAKDDEVLIDKVQIRQVLVNLMRNAREAMSQTKDPRMTVSTRLIEKDMIQIDVADTGPGLSSEVEDRLFEPFNTTKATGMGIGLSISRSIIEAHYGKLWAGANPGGGAVFSFTLPLACAEFDE